MEMLRKKLKSQKGVSILMALFLFLACAVVGSVVLTAATAASGRRVQLDISDQRYYSVDSAAGVIRDAITDKSVVVIRQCSIETAVSYNLVQNDLGEVTSKKGPYSTVKDPVYKTYLPLPGSNVNLSEAMDDDLLYFAAANMIPGLTSDGKSGFDSEIYGTKAAKQFTISVPQIIDKTDMSFLKVSCTMTVAENGDLVFMLSSGGDASFVVKEVFRLVYGETSNRSTTESNHTVTGTGNDSLNKYFREDFSITETIQKKGTFKWEFVSCDID